MNVIEFAEQFVQRVVVVSGKIRHLVQVFILSICCQPGLAVEIEQLGNIEFPTSATEAAQEHFLTGVAYLHSFGWLQAREEFQQAQTLDADFALAYWGEALTYNHPLYPERDLTSPARVLNKLGANSEERLRKAASTLEQGFLNAVEAYTFTQGDSQSRRLAYLQAMQSLFEAFPNHTEVRAFYALALLSAAAELRDSQWFQLRHQAGAIANTLLFEKPRHPGAMHYLIHSYDDPDNAHLALDAANRYVEIAPIVAHARHMPSHIYIHLGKWFDAADLNETALFSARAQWRPGDDPREQNHAVDFGQYADLQLANYDLATQWIERAEDILIQNPDSIETAETVARLRARLVVESRQWEISSVETTKTNDELFAIGISAINMRDLALARDANKILKERIELAADNFSLRISQLELEASLLFATGNIEASLNVIDEATTLFQQHPNTDPLPNHLKPVFELKGEMLLRSGDAEAAVSAFKQSLLETPYRPWSVLGLARSYKAIGDNLQASQFYTQLLDSWEDTRLLGVSEARTHLSYYR